MGYSGKYECPVKPCDVEFTTDVRADRYLAGESGIRELVHGTASQARVTMLDHGRNHHNADWTSLGNETFLPAVLAPETRQELVDQVEHWKGVVGEWEAGNLVLPDSS